MKIIIVGAGLIGVSTAYFLGLRGHEVTVLDRQEGPGRETSFANGALLTPSMSEPWNAPGCWRALVGSLGRSDAPVQLRLRPLPQLIGWGVKFLKNSSPDRYVENTGHNLRLALFSLEAMRSLRERAGIEYGATAQGSLKLFRSEKALKQARATLDRPLIEGLAFRVLTRKEAIELEPALAPIAGQLAGAIHHSGDETGDAHRFCLALTEQARKLGVEFSFGTTVSEFELNSGHVTAVRTDNARLVADHYVAAAASYTAPLLRPIGLHLPVRPAKGYSVTFDPSQRGTLKIPIVDDEMHAALVPLGDALRAAGTAEFAGYDLTLRPERVRNLVELARRLLPEARLNAANARTWCGLRPMSADGVPIIGRTTISNLWVNTGHGHLGWTMAAGSGQLLAQLMSGEAPSLDISPYALARF